MPRVYAAAKRGSQIDQVAVGGHLRFNELGFARGRTATIHQRADRIRLAGAGRRRQIGFGYHHMLRHSSAAKDVNEEGIVQYS